MCKDYRSLEMASFIGRLRVFAPKNCFITPSLRHRGPRETHRRRGGGKRRKRPGEKFRKRPKKKMNICVTCQRKTTGLAFVCICRLPFLKKIFYFKARKLKSRDACWQSEGEVGVAAACCTLKGTCCATRWS